MATVIDFHFRITVTDGEKHALPEAEVKKLVRHISNQLGLLDPGMTAVFEPAKVIGVNITNAR